MGLFKSFMGAIGCGEPEGPYCTLLNLKHDWGEYKKHIEKAGELLFSTLSDERWTLVTKDYNGKSPTDLLSRVRWEYLRNVRSWVADEFIPKIEKFRRKIEPPKSRYGGYELGLIEHRRNVIDHGDRCPVMDAKNHLLNARQHGESIVTELHFFLCDERSPFDQRASLHNGNCTPHDCVRWYIGGKHIVESNMKRADDTLAEFIAFAESKGAR